MNETHDATHQRADESRVTRWLLLEGNRLVVTGVLTAAVGVSFVVVVGTLDPPFVEQIAAEDTIETLFATMLTVIVTGTTLVLTIGQLVLTQENGPLGDQRERMAASMAARDSVAELIGDPSPIDPAAFVGAILEETRDRAVALRASVTAQSSGERDALDAAIDDVTGAVIADADNATERLDGAQFGSFAVVSAALSVDYSVAIYRIERIVEQFDADLTADDRRHLDALKAALELFGPAREHIKTLYFQWALIELSRHILYAAVPALAVAGIMVAVVDAGTVPGTTLGIENVVFVVGAAFAVTLVPFMLFVASLLRILTVAKRTLAIEPLSLRE